MHAGNLQVSRGRLFFFSGVLLVSFLIIFIHKIERHNEELQEYLEIINDESLENRQFIKRIHETIPDKSYLRRDDAFLQPTLKSILKSTLNPKLKSTPKPALKVTQTPNSNLATATSKHVSMPTTPIFAISQPKTVSNLVTSAKHTITETKLTGNALENALEYPLENVIENVLENAFLNDEKHGPDSTIESLENLSEEDERKYITDKTPSEEEILKRINEAEASPSAKLYDNSRSSFEIPLKLDRMVDDSEEENIMLARIKHYDSQCKWGTRREKFEVPGLSGRHMAPEYFYQSLSQLFVDDKYKLMMCSVPKAATSNWQRVFNSLKHDGKIQPEDFTGYRVHKISTRFTDILKQNPKLDPQKELEKRINDPEYTVFMNVRHPFTRLISAWRDKFDRTKSSFKYWERKFGKFILMNYERKEYLVSKPDSHMISKEAFLDYVADVNVKHHDHHWKSFSKFCKPCFVRYNYITHAETSQDDGEYILKKANVSEIVHLPGVYASSPTLKKSTVSLFKNVSGKTVEKLFGSYREDFEIFGYSVEDFLKD